MTTEQPGIDTPVTVWDITNMGRTIATGAIDAVQYTVMVFDRGEQAAAEGTIELDPADPETLVPYPSVTKELAVGWVKEKLGEEKIEEIETALLGMISEKLSPTRAVGVPWS